MAQLDFSDFVEVDTSSPQEENNKAIINQPSSTLDFSEFEEVETSSEETVEEIYIELREGTISQDIADMFGISRG